MVVLRSSSALISREGDLLTLVSSFSAGEVVSILLQYLLAISVLPTSLDNTLLSSPIILLGSCSLMSDIFQTWKLKNVATWHKEHTFFMILSFSYKKIVNIK